MEMGKPSYVVNKKSCKTALWVDVSALIDVVDAFEKLQPDFIGLSQPTEYFAFETTHKKNF